MRAEVRALLAQLAPAIGDQRVLAAIASVPRECFVAPQLRAHAYDNVALAIGHEQTISQPLVIARMCELLEIAPGDRVLDVGTGSGYHAAVLAALGARVWTIERCAPLARAAAAALGELGLRDITCLTGDGAEGVPEQAPFDAINVAAASAAIPGALVGQLAVGGRLVAPVGDPDQYLVRVRRGPDGATQERHEAVRFVALVTGG